MPRGILITGARGLIGSALTHRLATAGEARVVALDTLAPDEELRRDTPGAVWIERDLQAPDAIESALDALADCSPRVVCHLAAHWDFEDRWSDAYQRTNVDAVRALRDACIARDIDHLVFASSLTVHGPPAPGEVLTETSEPDSEVPYGLSKRRGEALLQATADQLRTTILRIGGVFTEHCELPPLYGLLSLWLGPWPLSRTVLGRGKTAMPYVHRADLVALLERCVLSDDGDRGATLLACAPEAVDHAALFARVHPGRRPIPVPRSLAALAMRSRELAARALGTGLPVERLWMLGYLDRPLRIDNTATTARTGWRCREERDIREVLPRLLEIARADPEAWQARNELRNARRYRWQPDRD